MARRPAIVALAFALAAPVGSRTAARGPVPPAPTFSGEIRSILQTHCAICHSPGGPSPMPLGSYDEVLPWARAIEDQTLTRRMPVWHAARGYGAFANDPSLTPYELSMIAEWVAAGSPSGQAETALPAPKPTGGGLVIAAGATRSTIRTRTGWIIGWDFTPGDPLITSMTFTSAGGTIVGAWVAGDRAVRLPRGSAIHVVPPLHVEIHRRGKATYETPFTPRRSTLRLTSISPPSARSRRAVARRVWTERIACGGTIGPAKSSILAVRPLLASGATAQIAVERLGGAQPVLLGWFRDFDPAYARIYWLSRPLEFAAGARITSDAPCDVEVMLSGRR